MVFRKPYAFFIKNFRKFHLLLIVVCGFIYSNTLQVIAFNKDFLTYLSYDSYFEPISKYLTPLLYISIFLVILVFMVLLIVLKRKGKPWKLYLIPIFEYIALTLVFFYIGNFYNHYDGSFATTTVRALNNFLSIAKYLQYIVFLILIVRVLGLDIKNFNFSADQEFLELNQEDREEFEVSIDFDKHSFKRTIKKTKRNLDYFYQEHKFICNIVFCIITFFIMFRIYYYFGVSHKTITENEVFNVNNYSMVINKSFYTDKDKKGNIIEKDSAFVILNISVLNNGGSRKFKGDDFHIVNGNKKYTHQGNTYSDYFSDLGKSFPIEKIKNGQQKDFALIFKVSKDLDYNSFVLYYQEYKGYYSYLRKIKLNLSNVQKIKDKELINIGEKIEVINFNKEKKEFTFEKIRFLDNINYNIETCDKSYNCSITTKNILAPYNSKIMEIEFLSPDYEGVDLIKISKDYAKILYTDDDGISKEIEIKNALSNKDYLGKYLYVVIPRNLENAQSIEFVYTFRTKRHSYNIR